MGQSITLPINPGDRFGRLTVVAEDRRTDPGNPARTLRVARCLCDCGAAVLVRPGDLKSGRQVSCGCHKRAVSRAAIAERNLTHGLSSHPYYSLWHNMMARCYDSDSPTWEYYGGRGIVVCAAWHDVTSFIEWIETHLGSRPAGFTLDRVRVSGAYEPGNVRWASWAHQQANRRGKSGTSSRFKGVYWRRDRGKWAASIMVAGRRRHLGQFPGTEQGEISAARAYDREALWEWGEHACLNMQVAGFSTVG